MELLEPPFSDPEAILTSRKKLRRTILASGGPFTKTKIAVLGGSTTRDIIGALDLFLLDCGIEAEFYDSAYGSYWEEGVFGAEGLVSFKPDFTYIHTSSRNLSFPDYGAKDQDAWFDDQKSRFARLWDELDKRLGSFVIQNNFELPSFRAMGNKEASDPRGRVYLVSRLNQFIAERAQNNDKFFVNDINWLSAEFGLSKWSDPKHWYLYKYICGPSAIPTLAFSIRNIVKALLGKNKKAVSVDLDNTLWGGIVGDDGPEGIKIGPEGPIGQAHLGLQQYLKDLRSIGVVLCVNSKNDMENAIAGLNHPSGVLKPDDFALIKANWEPKSENLLNTASELGLLPESFVFIDDNPAERALVKAQGGGALAPDLTDPEKYVIELDRLGLFEATTLSKEDMRRSLLYKEEAKRTELRKSSGSYEEFLASLDMRSNISPINPMTAQRSTELVNKSNQFNLTTLRCAQARMDEWSKSDTHLALSADLEDKIGNHGLVSVVVGEFKDHDFHVLIWVMSCRVLKRRLEEAVLDKLVDLCKEKGAKAIIGYFYPTKKNSMVKEFYPSMGFSLQSEDEEKNTAWVLDVSSHVSKAPPIRAAGGESGCN